MRPIRRRRAATRSGIASKGSKDETKGSTGQYRSSLFCKVRIDETVRPRPRDQTAIGAVSGSWWR